jgi:hypothetical protein
VITELKLLMHEEFNLCNTSLCRRECNNVAHALAAIACKFPNECKTSRDGVPHEVEVLVTSDLARSDE